MIELAYPTIFHMEEMEMVGNKVQMPFHRIGTKTVDGEEIAFYEVIQDPKEIQ